MNTAVKGVKQAGQSHADLLIIGAGIMGLWAAVHAGRLGLKTVLIDEGRVGGGASGGVLGALMPYMPDKWDLKKQFQLEALVSLPSEIARLESETGRSAGYHRSGRLIPLPKPHLRTIALRHEKDARENWSHGGQRFFWNIIDAPIGDGWLDGASGASGFVHDTLAARVSPRALLALLAAALSRDPNVELHQDCALLNLDTQGLARTSAGDIAFSRCIIAAGHKSFSLLQAMSPPLPQPLGQAVKGQAALLRANADPSLPVIFRDGLYIVPHEGGDVAVGSTSENHFDDPVATDQKLDTIIEAARNLVPVLADAAVIERWAGLRPKAIDRDPMVGPHPDFPRVIALTGGFKISFGLAHRLAEAAVCQAINAPAIALPAGFTFENHLQVAAFPASGAVK